MKKLLLVAFVAMFGALTAVAQPRAIGGNVGAGIGFSYQHGFGEKNMLDVAATIPFVNWGVGGHVTYDWIDPFNTSFPWDKKGEWHWAMGVGGAGGIYGFSDVAWYVGAAGHIGVAYDFWFPLELSVDWRPSIGVLGNHDGSFGFNVPGLYAGNITIGVRYLFNK